jgi:anion-transporting  ArsA/GET3 family ATPase
VTILDKRVMLCLGSGGVGKTTVAAAVALALASQGERVVVLTIDPARRLADALGLRADSASPGRSSGNTIEEVNGPSGPIWATMLDPGATFEAVIRDETSSEEQANRILDNPLFHNLARSLSGTNEYMAAERLHQLYNDSRFDRVIVDTPPSRHALDFLDSPQRLSRFINHRLYRSVFAPRSGLLRTVSAGSQIILRLLGRLVGSRLVDDVVTFFASFEGLDAGFDRRSNEITRVLEQDTAFTLVTSARRAPLDEANWIAGNVVDRLGRDDAIDAMIVNRLCPVESEINVESDLAEPLAMNLTELGTVAAQEEALISDFCDVLGHVPQTIRLYEQNRPVSDLQGLHELATMLAQDLIPDQGVELS